MLDVRGTVTAAVAGDANAGSNGTAIGVQTNHVQGEVLIDAIEATANGVGGQARGRVIAGNVDANASESLIVNH